MNLLPAAGHAMHWTSVALTLLLATWAGAFDTEGAAQPSLANTSWQLVRLRIGSQRAVQPDSPARYVVTFGGGGELTVRIDCNRGRGTWKTPAGDRIELGPLALTRMKCPYGSLHDVVVKHWTSVRSFTLRDRRLVLSLPRDGGEYEFARADEKSAGAR